MVFDGAESDLTYQWRFYANSIDTLGADKVLRTQVSNAPGSYSVELQVTQKSNNLSALMRYQVEVVAPVPSGWMVLYEKGGNTDVDLIRSPLFIAGAQEGIKRSIYSASNGASLPGKPVSVLFVSNDISYIFTTETGVKVQNTDFARAQDFNQLFVGTAPLAQPEGFWLGSFNRGALVNGGKTYWFDSDAIIGEVTIDEKGYEAAPFVYPHYTKYGGFYDQKNMRFAIIEQQTSQAGLFPNATGNARFNLNNRSEERL